MILVILVGLYALISARVRITHTFTLTGQRARLYGALLIALALPAAFAANAAYRLLVPTTMRLQPFARPVANVLFLAIFIFGLAALCRDKPAREDAAVQNTLPPSVEDDSKSEG